MKVIRLPFGYKIMLEREKPTDLGDKLMSIDIRQNGAAVSLVAPLISINPRAVLLAAVHQETYINDFRRISAMDDIDTVLWNARALKYRGDGDPMAYTRALTDVIGQKCAVTSERDKDAA
jgi:hypothetical protein